ncbi:hypothetical protein [Flammeovirga aprica]|uniref:Uncharacterized protein n=1 Tax=Flammeovirga aprica JL-4 TaxID=694437 RepID=A0A7X9RZ26_9BACT|nr:hypothetical protein [Flammeovirga aprica]NME71259.1 hypothetical protein [Flammeovirga aprica JL-4]
MFCQVEKDKPADNYIYPPNSYNNYEGLTPKESWDIHKAAYIKQLKSKGSTGEEYDKSILEYEKQKEEFLTQVKEQNRIAEVQREKDAELRKQHAIQREKDAELRKQHAIQREKDAELRKQHAIQREKDAELRKQHAIQREKDAELRKQHAIQREKDAELRKQHAIQREKDAELRKQHAIQREKDAELRKKSQAWREHSEEILIKNITLSTQSNGSKPITFNVPIKTTLYIGVRAHIRSGNALIEIFNPKGIKEGELSLKYQPNSNENSEGPVYTSGALDKTISNTEVGEWQIKISSQKSNGNIAMSVAQSIKPTADE